MRSIPITNNPRRRRKGHTGSSLIYSTFYAAGCPVVICEGTTDNVYLTHAIRSLAAEFPTLAEIVSEDEIRLKVRLYKYPRSSTARILGLNDGGSSVLGKFIHTYRAEARRFYGPGLKHAVVILYDNDDGARSVQGAIQQVAKREFGISVAGTEPYVRVFKNLYALPTPGRPSKIEDFFDDDVKATKIGGKTFNDGAAEFDPTKHYGKAVFARQVVAANAKAIDFAGFRPLLRNLVAALESYRKLIPSEEAEQIAAPPRSDGWR